MRALFATVLLATAVGCRDSPTGPSSPPPPPVADASLSPVPSTDEWPVASPAEQGVDPGPLTEVFNRIRRREYGNINSLLVVRRERLVMEEYFNGWNAATAHTQQSVTKSVTSLAAGLAIDRGRLRVSDSILPLFPDYQPVAAIDANKQALTVRDLLTMRTGYDWSEQNYSGSPLERLNTCFCDWIRLMLDWRLREAPGARFEYVSGGVILLGAAIERGTGVRVDRFLDAELFTPLGFGAFEWFHGQPQGLPHTGGGLSLRPRDMAKLGTLIVTRGRWQGRQIISEAWIRESTQTQPGPPHVFGGRPTTYSYLWWGLPGGVTTASGARGQWIFAVPDRELVVVSTAGNDDGNASAAVRILYDYILPALR